MALFVGETLRVDRDNDGSLVVTLDVPGRSVNLVTRQVLADLEGALSALESQSRLPVVVLRSGKKTGFLAGADLNEIARLTSAKEAMAFAEAGQSLFSRWSRLPGPTLAVIHGPCLGGGLELALACDYRMLFARENTQLGLPEVELGLLPAWGGTQRLPRIIGLERALVLLLSARRIPARQVLDWGLADALATNDAEFREQYARMLMKAISGGKRSLARLPLRTWRQRFLESQFFGRRILFRSVDRQIRQRTPDDFPAPFEI
ncbi:MAG: enoyl-CoA hydratase-related protein, partial [Gemmataceae bacterium]